MTPVKKVGPSTAEASINTAVASINRSEAISCMFEETNGGLSGG
jgi:hypothetical protein